MVRETRYRVMPLLVSTAWEHIIGLSQVVTGFKWNVREMIVQYLDLGDFLLALTPSSTSSLTQASLYVECQQLISY